MVSPSSVGTAPSRSWIVPALRAVIAAVAAMIITFSADHSPALGLSVFAGFAVLTGAVQFGLVLRARDGSVSRTLLLTSGAATVIAGVVAAVLVVNGPTVSGWLLLILIWAALTGVLELVAGLRARGQHPQARDWTVAGIFAMLLAAIFAFVPADLNLPYGGMEEIQGAMTAPILTVGLFGAYAAILAVYLGIGALSQKWGTDRPATASSTVEAAQ